MRRIARSEPRYATRMTDIHPNGPRTFGTSLRDAVPLPHEMVERIIAVEAGRHPTLTELRAALGLDLDLSEANNAARAAWPERGMIPNDEDFARVIDAMYASATSTRLIRVEINETGAHPTRHARADRASRRGAPDAVGARGQQDRRRRPLLGGVARRGAGRLRRSAAAAARRCSTPARCTLARTCCR